MQNSIANRHGMIWGLIIGIFYCATLALRYKLADNDTVLFGMLNLVSFIGSLILLLIAGFQFRRKNGGYAETKEVFKALFVTVLISELIYVFFNFFFLKYVEPQFYVRFKAATENMLNTMKTPAEEMDKVLAGIDPEAPSKMNLFDVFKSYFFFVAVYGAFSFLFSLIIRRTRPFTDTENINKA